MRSAGVPTQVERARPYRLREVTPPAFLILILVVSILASTLQPVSGTEQVKIFAFECPSQALHPGDQYQVAVTVRYAPTESKLRVVILIYDVWNPPELFHSMAGDRWEVDPSENEQFVRYVFELIYPDQPRANHWALISEVEPANPPPSWGNPPPYLDLSNECTTPNANPWPVITGFYSLTNFFLHQVSIGNKLFARALDNRQLRSVTFIVPREGGSPEEYRGFPVSDEWGAGVWWETPYPYAPNMGRIGMSPAIKVRMEDTNGNVGEGAVTISILEAPLWLKCVSLYDPKFGKYDGVWPDNCVFRHDNLDVRPKEQPPKPMDNHWAIYARNVRIYGFSFGEDFRGVPLIEGWVGPEIGAFMAPDEQLLIDSSAPGSASEVPTATQFKFWFGGKPVAQPTLGRGKASIGVSPRVGLTTAAEAPLEVGPFDIMLYGGRVSFTIPYIKIKVTVEAGLGLSWRIRSYILVVECSPPDSMCAGSDVDDQGMYVVLPGLTTPGEAGIAIDPEIGAAGWVKANIEEAVEIGGRISGFVSVKIYLPPPLIRPPGWLGLGLRIEVWAKLKVFPFLGWSGEVMKIEARLGSYSTSLQQQTFELQWIPRAWATTPDYGKHVTWLLGQSSGYFLQNINMFPNPSVAASPLGDVIAVWVQDDLAKTYPRSFEVYYSTFDPAANTWRAPSAVTNDGFIQESPVVEFDRNGNAIAVWNTAKDETVTTAVGPQSLAGKGLSEVACSIWNRTSRTWSVPTLLTNNNLEDHTPRLVRDENGDIMLIWLRNEDPNNLLANAVYASTWNGREWSPEARVVANVPTSSLPHAAYHFGKALVVWPQHMDGNFTTKEDVELFASAFDGSTWGAPSRLTTNGVEEQSPFVRYDRSGVPRVVWLESRPGANNTLTQEVKIGEFAAGGLQSIESVIVRDRVASPQLIITEANERAVVWSDGVFLVPYVSMRFPEGWSAGSPIYPDGNTLGNHHHASYALAPDDKIFLAEAIEPWDAVNATATYDHPDTYVGEVSEPPRAAKKTHLYSAIYTLNELRQRRGTRNPTSLRIDFIPSEVDIGKVPPGSAHVLVTLNPTLQDKSVLLYYGKDSANGPWTPLSSGLTNPAGQFAVDWVPSEVGRYYFKAYFPGDGSYMEATATTSDSMTAIPEFPAFTNNEDREILLSPPGIVAVILLAAVIATRGIKKNWAYGRKFARRQARPDDPNTKTPRSPVWRLHETTGLLLYPLSPKPPISR